MGLVETILLVFGIVGLGFLAARFRILGPGTGDGLADFVFVIAVPLLLFKTMSSTNFGAAAPWRLWLAYFSGILIAWIVSYLLVRFVFGRDRRAGVVAGLSGSFSNLVLLGIPFMLGVYGHDGFAVLSLLVSVHLPIMLAVTVVLFEWASRRDGIQTDEGGAMKVFTGFVRNLASNPLIIGIVAGWIWRFTGLALPDVLSQLLNRLSGVAGPVALFAMGMSLTKFGISGNVRPSVALALCKVIIMPAAVICMALLIGLPPFTAKIAVAAASMPSGVNPYLIATRFGTGQALASNSMVIATGTSVLTTGLWLAIASAVFG